METFIIIFISIVVLLVWAGIASSRSEERAREKARKAYEESLDALKNNPTNAELKQQTLALGRVYSNLTRNSQGVTTVDEVSLMNDINAACAAATSINITTQQEALEDRLNKLSTLLEKGLITQSEYDSRRKEILDSI